MTLFRFVFFCFLFCIFSFTTFANNTLKITEPNNTIAFNRIVSLKPNITQMVESLGLKDRIVGITKFCPKPNNTAEIVADYNSMNVESIVRLKPDLVLISPENTRTRDYDALVQAGIRTELLSFKNYTQMKESLTTLSQLLGVQEKGEELKKSMDAKLAQLREIILSKNLSNQFFIIIIQRQPLMVASGNTYLSSLLTEIGLKNSFEANQIAYPVLDEEDLIRELVAYTFDLSHQNEGEASDEFFNKKVIRLKLEDFNAAPQSLDNLVTLINKLPPPQTEP